MAITETYAKALPVEYKTTLKLNSGDVVQHGNCIYGFSTYTIVAVENTSYSKNMARVTIRWNHGGEVTSSYGKNTKWAVVKVGN